MTQFETSRAFAERLDADDALAHFRSQFYFPKSLNGNDCIYFCGNSLGLQPKAAREYVTQELEDWAAHGVEGHFSARNPWLPYHELLTEQTARLVGATPVEVVVMNTLTVNLHLMMVSFYRPTADRHRILIEANAFPSDQYAVKSQIKFHGYLPDTALLEPPLRPGEATHRTEDILSFLEKEGDSIALVMLAGVNYYSGQAFDMKAITEAGHRKGCLVGFDLAHAAGNLVLELHDWDVDFAVWCSYKYLNSGPGSLAGCFIHERYADDSQLPRFAGWWGQDKESRFKMGPDFKAIRGAEGWQLSNPPILPLAVMRSSLDLFDRAGMPALRAKSEKLTGYLAFLLKTLENKEISILTPERPEERGCQLSIRIGAGGKKIYGQLKERGVICDWREPDVIRIAPVPLYNRFTDCFDFYETLAQLLTSKRTP